MHMRILGLEKNKYREFLSKNIYYFLFSFLLFLSIILVICKIHIGIYLVFMLLGFGWSIFFLKKRLNILEHFFSSFLIFLIILLPFSILFAFLNIALKEWVFISFLAISLIIFLFGRVFKKESINLKVNKMDVVVLFIFLSACFAKIASVKDLLVPGLHDSMAHVHYANRILTTGFIDFFYSPGLHILSAFSNMFNGFDLPRQILFITNFFNAYGGVIAYIVIKKVFKSDVWALLLSLLFSFGYYPSVFFVNAGKNALVLAVPLVLFILFLLNENRIKRNIKVLVLTSLSLFTIFIVHYPTAVFVCALLLCFLIFYFREAKWRNLLVISGVVLGLLWMIKAYTSQVVQSPPVSMEENPLFMFPENILLSIKTFLNQIFVWIKSANSNLYYLVSASSVFGLIAMTFISFKERNKKYGVILLWSFISFLIGAVISVFRILDVAIVQETFVILIFVYIYIFAGFLFTKLYVFCSKYISNKLLLKIFIIFVIAVTPYFSYKIFQTYKVRSEMHNVINQDDIKAFQWIDNNIDNNQKFIINCNGDNGLVFSTDGGGWLEIYTENEISTPFYDFASQETDMYADLYRELKVDINNCQIINKFVQDGYIYYYQGSSPVFDTQLASEEIFENSSHYEIVYDEESVAIYKLIPCQ